MHETVKIHILLASRTTAPTLPISSILKLTTSSGESPAAATLVVVSHRKLYTLTFNSCLCNILLLLLAYLSHNQKKFFNVAVSSEKYCKTLHPAVLLDTKPYRRKRIFKTVLSSETAHIFFSTGFTTFTCQASVFTR